MARVTWVQNNFNGGEWSPLTYGRFDIAKYKNALSKCLNFVPLAQGGLTRRPGFRYVAAAKQTAPVRLQKFEFSVEQAYMLEFGAGYIRIYANEGQLLCTGAITWVPGFAASAGEVVLYGSAYYYAINPSSGESPSAYPADWYPIPGTAVEIPTPYLQSELFQLQFAQSADTLYIVHPNHPPMTLGRAGPLVWPLTSLVPGTVLDGPYLPLNSTTTTVTPSNNNGPTITMNASSTAGINGGNGFSSSDVGRCFRWQQAGAWYWGVITSYTSTTSVVVTLKAIPDAPTPRQALATATLGGGSVMAINITDVGAGYGVTAPSVTITGGGGSGAIAYASVTDGSLSSAGLSVTGAGYTSAPTVTVAAPTVPAGTATTFWRLGAWCSANGYPTTVIFYQDRLMFGGMTQYPTRVDGSQTGSYLNFSPTNIDGSVPDSSALSFNLNSNQANVVRWMISDEWGLLVGTSGSEWVISPSNQQTALSPSNINAKQSTVNGVADIPAIRIGKATLFIQRAGRKLREMMYAYLYNTFQAPDISLIGEHLTTGGILQMVYALAPTQQIWMCRNDGTLIGVSYDKDQDINGWHQHALGGFSDAAQTLPPTVNSVGVIPSSDGTRDELWVSVTRYINGAQVQTIEYAAKFWENGDTINNACFVDCSAEYNGAPTTTVTGLTWLVGQTVSVLTDGSVHPNCVVSNAGAITLNWSASVVQVGLGYTSQATTMQIEAGGQEGPTQGKYKRIRNLIMRFFQTVGINLAPLVLNAPTIAETFRTPQDLMDTAIPPYSGDYRWAWEGTWDESCQVNFTQADPVPANVLLLSAMMETQEG